MHQNLIKQSGLLPYIWNEVRKGQMALKPFIFVWGEILSIEIKDIKNLITIPKPHQFSLLGFLTATK